MRLLTAVLVLAAAAVAAPPENLPSDSCIALHLDVASLAKTKVYEHLAGSLRELCETIGFRLQDVASVTLGLCGDLDDPDAYFTVRGTFDAAKVETFLTGLAEYQVTRKDGMTLLLPKSVTGDDAEVAILDGVILLGTARGSLEKMLAARKAGAPESEVSKLLRSAGEAQLSCAVLGTDAVRKSMAEDPDMEILAGLKSLVITANVREKVEVSYDLRAEGALETVKGTATFAPDAVVSMLLDEIGLDEDSEGATEDGCDEPCGCAEPFGDD